MDSKERRIGSVKEVIDSYGERITDGNSLVKKLQKNYAEKQQHPTRRELHEVRRDTSQFNESKRLAESISARAETELSTAKNTIKTLTSAIEQSELRAKTQLEELEKLKMSEKSEAQRDNENENSRYTKVLRELKSVKQELSKLKLEMASILDEKRRAEKETKSAESKMVSYSTSLESLTKEIDEINEEHVLVELARIEAIKEYEEIEAQKKEAEDKHLSAVEEAKKKMNEMMKEIEEKEELEEKLAITLSDIKMLENIKEIKEMDKKLHRASKSTLAIESIEDEYVATKRELALIRDESFQFMSSMDIVRDELKHVMDETARLRRKEEKADRTIQNLNSKLLRAKAKLEAVSAAEDKAKSIASNLSHTLDQLKSEADLVKQERTLIEEETEKIRDDVRKTEGEIDLAEERLHIALEELKKAKSSEAIALKNLEAIIGTTMKTRALISRDKSTITISKFEHDYLMGHAAEAEEIADKKVAAAEAWVEALRASEKEILIKIEVARKETARELQVEEDNREEGSLREKDVVEDDWRKYEAEVKLPRRSMNMSGKMTPTRRSKHRKLASPLVRNVPRSGSFTVRRRRKVMPNLSKFFRREEDGSKF